MSSTLDKALTLATKGYYVLPLAVSDDGRKMPLIKWGTGASRTESEIRAMPWDAATHVAVACEPSGVVVIDIDKYHDEDLHHDVEGDELIKEWQALVREHNPAGEEAPEFDPPWVTTLRNGVHAFLRADPNQPMTNSVKDLSPCIDVRGVGGLVAIYAEVDAMPSPDELPVVPGWLSALAVRESEHLTPKAPPADPKYSAGEAGTAYGLKGLSGELAKIIDAWERDAGDFNHVLNTASFAIGSLAASGHLEPDHAHQEIIDQLADLDAPIDQYKTVDSGFRSGYERPRIGPKVESTDESVAEHAARWLTGEQLDQIPPPKWLVPGWLELDSVAQVYGPPKEGKTHVVYDLAASVSAGLSWPVKGAARLAPQRVAYVVTEGVSGFADRKRAWEAKWGRAGQILYYPDAIQINSKNLEWLDAIRFLADWGAKLIVLDTQARCTVGVDENKPVDMGVIVHEIERLRRATGACVLLVHHTSKYGNRGRGTNAVEGAINSGLLVQKRKGRFRVTNPFQKNGEEAKELWFRLTSSGPSVVPVPAEGPAEITEEEGEKIVQLTQKTNQLMLIRTYLEGCDTWQTLREITIGALEKTEEEATRARGNVHKKLTSLVGQGVLLVESRKRGDGKTENVYLWNHSRMTEE